MKLQANKKEYEVIYPKVETGEEIRTRDNERMLLAYDLAKQICEFAKDYSEVKDIIQKIGCVFEWHHSKQRPEIPKNPISPSGFELKEIMSRENTQDTV